MTKIRKLAGDTILYGLGNIVPRFMNFVLFPIHTRFRFDPEEFGVFTYLMSLVAFMNIIYSFGMETTFFRFATKPGADPKRVFNIGQTVVIVVGVIISGSIIIFAQPIATALKVGDHPDFIVWLAAIMFIDNLAALPFSRLRLENRPVRFAIYRIANIVVVVVLNLYFLFVIYDPAIGIGYIFLAMLIANSMYIVFFFKSFIQWRPTYDREMSSSMLSYSFPIVLTGLLGTTNEFFSRISLEKWLPEGFYPGQSSAFALGVFGASYRFAVFMQLAVTAYRMAAEPFFFNNAADKESPKLFATVNHYFVIVCCFMLLGISINMDVLKQLMAPSYWEGIVVVVPLLLGYLFFGIYYNMTVWYKLTDKTIYGTYITVGGAALTIALNYIFIPMYGYLGSAWVTTFVYLAMTITCYLLGQKFYPIPYTIFSDALYIIGTTALVYIVNLYTFENVIVGVVVHGLVLFAWLGIVYFINLSRFNKLKIP
ncbi:MAG TPA: oligosaccharide flippase family protein [Cyclobacteriaceae bacterium]|nr:oligosaccharide flippase family protein [Cyclobacteriaceae bacterium]